MVIYLNSYTFNVNICVINSSWKINMYGIEQLKFSKSNNQVSLHTVRALSKLEFLGRDEYDKQIFI